MSASHTPGPWAREGYCPKAAELSPEGSAVRTITDAANVRDAIAKAEGGQ